MENNIGNRILCIGNLGFIGSRLLEDRFFSNTYGIDINWFNILDKVDENIRDRTFVGDYNNFSKEFYSEYDTIILLAGHASVPSCVDNDISVFNNNVRNFINLMSKIDDQKFIYASSSSLYSGAIDTLETSLLTKATNSYDLSKKIIDEYSLLGSKSNFYGLRFGTVVGASKQNFRKDLLLNQMVISARTTGIIQGCNPTVRRPTLWIQDLINAIKTICTMPDNPGIYNLCSMNNTILGYANATRDYLNSYSLNFLENKCRVEWGPSTPCYDFYMEATKFERNYSFKFKGTIEKIVRELDLAKLENLTERKNKILYL